MQKQKLKDFLQSENLALFKNLDQHFLTDESILQREVDYANVSGEDTVLEIGAGIGVLTKFLSARAKKTFSVEKDQRFRSYLEKIPNTEVIIADALKIDFPECNKIVGNIPYSIASPLIFKVLELPVEVVVFCLQKEFADRMTALTGTSDYSRLTVNCSIRAEVEFLETVPKSKFYPIPQVDSAIVRLTPKKINMPDKFDSITKALFQHKNKKVRNALLDSYHEISAEKEEVKAFAEKIGPVSQKRARELKPLEILELAEKW